MLYCTLEQVKSALSLPTPHTSNDETLETVIEAICRAIDEACDTQFFASSQTRYFTAQYFGALLVDDLLAVTTLKTDGDGDGVYETTWSATDYLLEPYNAPLASSPRPYYQIRQRTGGTYSFPIGVARGVELAASYGFCATGAHPKQVEIVSIRETVHHFHAIRSPFGSGGPGAGELAAVPPVGLSRNSLALLAPFRRIPIG